MRTEPAPDLPIENKAVLREGGLLTITYDWKSYTHTLGEWVDFRTRALMAEDHRGYSEETCIRCGWRMGEPAINCQNDNTPHRFPSAEATLDRLKYGLR